MKAHLLYVTSITSITSIAIATPLNSVAQEACKTEQSALQAIEGKYKPQYAEIQKRGDDLGKDTPSDADKVNFNFKVDMKEQKWILKLPSITMKRNEVVLGLPQTTMKLTTWSYDTIRVRMERRKTGQRPEFTCKKDDWGIPYDCTTTWSNTYTDVPVTDTVRTEVKLDIPQVVWKDTKLAWDVPQLTWVENTWIVNVPEFTLLNVAVEKGKDMQEKSDAISRDIAQINFSRNLESRTATTEMYGCFRNDMAKQQALVEKQIDEGIGSLNETIQNIRAQGADPTKVPSDGAQATDLVALLAEMVSKRKVAVDSFIAAQAQMDAAEKDAMSKLQGELPVKL